jgi:dCMP deaminase
MEKVCEWPMSESTDPMDRVYLTEAYKYARDKSQDPVTQVGCVLVSPSEGVVTYATNTFTHGINPVPSMFERPEKYEYFEHAERNAIYRCALKGFSTAGLYMYCPWWCCAECARGIVQSGISKFVGHHLMYELATNRWKESIDRGLELMTAAGIDVVNWDGRIERKDIKVVFDGETIIP